MSVKMKEFLEKYASLSNKNNPIIIQYGHNISSQIFNSQIDQQTLDKIIINTQSLQNVKVLLIIKEIFKNTNIITFISNHKICQIVINIKFRQV